MVWYIGFFAAATIIAVTVLAITGACASKHNKSGIRPFYILFAGCFLCGVAVSVAPYVTQYAGETGAFFRIFFLSILNAIIAYSGESMYAIVLDNISQAPLWMQSPYLAISLLLQVLAPILTFGFLLSFFKNLSAHIGYFFARRRDIYAFSHLNDRSLALATDIASNHKHAKIVFTGVNDESDESIARLTDDAKQIGAICFKNGMPLVNFGFGHSKKTAMYFFAISDNEIENIDIALDLSKKYGNRENTNLYVFSVGYEGELLLAGIKNGKMKIRRIDQTHSFVSRLLYDEGEKIFNSAGESEQGDYKQISAVIVGMGTYGKEMIRSLAWYCQMDGYRLKINAFEKDELAADKFEAMCPELISEKYNRAYVEGEAYYDITLHSGVDVNTVSFIKKLQNITDCTYVFVSLGSDEANIRTAVDIRKHCERMGIKPLIQAVVNNREVKEALSRATNFAHQPYGIDYIGDLRTLYSENVILGSALENAAFEVHKSYCNGDTSKENEFWKYEYCYRSSMASVVHYEARIKCGIAGAGKTVSELSESEKKTLKTLEHKRWNAYMRSEGYIYSGSTDKSTRNDLAKMHNNLSEFKKLSDEDQEKDIKVGAKIDKR